MHSFVLTPYTLTITHWALAVMAISPFGIMYSLAAFYTGPNVRNPLGVYPWQNRLRSLVAGNILAFLPVIAAYAWARVSPAELWYGAELWRQETLASDRFVGWVITAVLVWLAFMPIQAGIAAYKIHKAQRYQDEHLLILRVEAERLL